MKLDYRFYRLPIMVNSGLLQHEINSINNDQWIDHPNGFVGNSALPLISVNGKDNHDTSGPMMLCPRTTEMPYLMQILTSLGIVVGRSRLMRLSSGANVPRHCDTNLYWRKRVRIHIPIVTNSSVVFESNKQTQHMAEGEMWVLDTWHNHSVSNQGGERIHLVIDTVGSPNFWSLLENQSWKPGIGERIRPNNFKTTHLKFKKSTKQAPLNLEQFNDEPVIHPHEIQEIIYSYLDDLDHLVDSDDKESPTDILISLNQNWHSTWANFGVNSQHHIRYRLLVKNAIERLKALRHPPRLHVNYQCIASLLTQFVENLDEQRMFNTVISKTPALKKPDYRSTAHSLISFKPIFIVAAPRSGSTLLYETLSHHEQLMHYDAESHQIIESIPSLDIDANGSNNLYEKHATPTVSEQLMQQFIQSLGPQASSTNSGVTFLEKTPKNALRVAFLKAAFPNARFIYLFRQPSHNISSIIDGWKSGCFVTYQHLDGWNSEYAWSFLLPEGWRKLPSDDLVSVASHQYRAANQAIIHDLTKMKKKQAISLSYENFIQNPGKCLREICDFLHLPWSSKFDVELQRNTGLKHSKYTLDAPSPSKWLKNKSLMLHVLPEAQRFYNDRILTAAQLINTRIKG